MTRKIIAAPLLLGACLAVGLYTLNFARARYQRAVSPQTRQTVPFTKEITSCVKGVRVVKAEIVYAGTPDARVEVEIENVSNLGIVAVSLEATKCPESYMTTFGPSYREDKLIVVMKPHETQILNIPQNFADVPLQLGAAIYEDETEEGCASSLKTLHELKEAEKSKKESSHETSPHSPYPDSR